MARTRVVKPSFFKNEVLAELDPLARLLFIGLWTAADREGRLEDRPNRIKVEILPYDNCDVNGLLSALVGGGFIVRYAVKGRKLIQINNFLKHQTPHHKEISSDIPPLSKQDQVNDEASMAQGDRSLDSLNPDTLTRNNLNPSPKDEGTTDDDANAPAEAVQAWNAMAERNGLPVVKALTEARKRHLRARLAKCNGLEGWKAVMDRVEASDFLTGRSEGGNGWKADIDFVLTASKWQKIVEGSYDNRVKPSRENAADARHRQMREATVEGVMNAERRIAAEGDE